jgi:hypothetical protein
MLKPLMVGVQQRQLGVDEAQAAVHRDVEPEVGESGPWLASASTSLVWSRPATFNIGVPNSGLAICSLPLYRLVDHPPRSRRRRCDRCSPVSLRCAGRAGPPRRGSTSSGPARRAPRRRRTRPASLVRRCVLQRQDDAADARAALADARFAPGPAPLTFAARTDASFAVRCGRVGQSRGLARARAIGHASVTRYRHGERTAALRCLRPSAAR